VFAVAGLRLPPRNREPLPPIPKITITKRPGEDCVSFTDAVRACMQKYADFSGRARRSEYWWFYLFTGLVGVAAVTVLGVIALILDATWPLYLVDLVMLTLLVPSLAVTVRRLHDTGRSGWWWFLGFVPLVGPIILIVWFATDGQPGPNQYGPSPKYPAGPAYGYSAG